MVALSPGLCVTLQSAKLSCRCCYLPRTVVHMITDFMPKHTNVLSHRLILSSLQWTCEQGCSFWKFWAIWSFIPLICAAGGYWQSLAYICNLCLLIIISLCLKSLRSPLVNRFRMCSHLILILIAQLCLWRPYFQIWSYAQALGFRTWAFGGRAKWLNMQTWNTPLPPEQYYFRK